MDLAKNLAKYCSQLLLCVSFVFALLCKNKDCNSYKGHGADPLTRSISSQAQPRQAVAYSASALRDLKPQLNMRALNEGLCDHIKHMGLKRRFRGHRGRKKIITNTRFRDVITGVNLNNLRSLPRAPLVFDSSKNLVIGTVNTQSLRNKTTEVLHHIVDMQYDICTFTETWLKDTDTTIIADMKKEGYNFKEYNRKDRVGGGTAIMYKNSLDVELIDAGETTSYEFSEWKVNGDKWSLTVIVIYRPPYSPQHPVTHRQDNITSTRVPDVNRDSAHVPAERVIDASGRTMQAVALNCDRQTAKCHQIYCVIHGMHPGTSIAISMKGLLWNNTFLQDYRNVDEVRVSSKCAVTIPLALNVQQTNTNNDMAQATTRAVFDVEIAKRPPVIWIIVLAAIGAAVVGTSLVAMVARFLWKVGFFKRLTPEDMVKLAMQEKSHRGGRAVVDNT